MMFQRISALFLVLSNVATTVTAAKHTLVVGTFSTEFLYTLDYDDEQGTLMQVARSVVPAASSWLTLNVNADFSYACASKAILSTY
jgi:carboxy-cis,cis-muconate cyclase